MHTTERVGRSSPGSSTPFFVLAIDLNSNSMTAFGDFPFSITLLGDFASSYKGYLQDLIVAAGGAVLHRKPVASATQETFVLYNVEVPEKCSPSEASSSVVESRRKEAEALARASGAHAVGHSWVLDSIAACSLQPFT
ncbi:BREAST CANCER SUSCEPTIBILITY 1-like protein [Nymphaea thermarum]|nr:BREAST CANCER SUSCEPTIBILITY 1-like protein [Nymphaea thermarum]